MLRPRQRPALIYLRLFYVRRQRAGKLRHINKRRFADAPRARRWSSPLASLFYLYLAQPSQSHIVCMLMSAHTYKCLSRTAPPLQEGLTTDPHWSLMRTNRSDADKREAICMRLLITYQRPAGRRSSEDSQLQANSVLALTRVL